MIDKIYWSLDICYCRVQLYKLTEVLFLNKTIALWKETQSLVTIVCSHRSLSSLIPRLNANLGGRGISRNEPALCP